MAWPIKIVYLDQQLEKDALILCEVLDFKLLQNHHTSKVRKNFYWSDSSYQIVTQGNFTFLKKLGNYEKKKIFENE